ncbi:LysR family transcriptional regulator [Streptomyces sp. P38-E01]|uniref:LysR family transcriptional regulator n=1 Tax=Streptomyces tardus TaxID=2780544 RepID=A0A949JE24_9ACTN|nr:LysR family transcriptional regulator [Streptomyces tardus]MBU7596759.1 LysR family transcriptional regulator [Streptomyces tardus]
MLSWERLRVFAAVARAGSVRAAAEALHITGPAVSQQLRRLEKEAGCRLVEPYGRGIRLTHAGRLLAGSAQEMVESAERAQRELAAANTVVAGPLRIGAVASALRTMLPAVLRELSERHPRLEPALVDGEADDMLPLLSTGRLDAVVLESWEHWPVRLPAGVSTTLLLRESARVAVPCGHPLADARVLRLGEQRGQPWASCPPGSDAYEALVQLLRAHGDPEPAVRYAVADYTTMLRLVGAGLAFSLVPEMAAHPLPPGVRLLPVEPGVSRTVAAATLDGAATPPVKAFLSELRRAAAPPGRAPGPEPVRAAEGGPEP